MFLSSCLREYKRVSPYNNLILKYTMLSLFLSVSLAMTNCIPRERLIEHPAERTVRAMYRAWADGDMDAYMDTILPENRKRPNPFGLLSALSIGIGPVGIDLSKLTKVTLKDLKVSLVYAEDDYALVQVEGKVRYPIVAMEIDFCDQHDVRLYKDGKWYVDIYAPERVDRLERILNIRMQELQQMSEDPNSWDIFRAMGMSIERMSNLCE